MTQERYNGWSNYQTWVTKLWFDNDEGITDMIAEWAQSAYDDSEACSTFTREENARFALKDTVSDWFDEWQAETVGVTGVFADLLGHSVGMIDWHEIAESYLEEVEKEEVEA